jgi:tetratricopeptide (TPR) repeat protein
MQISERPELGEQAEAAVLSALALNSKNPRVWYELGQVKLSEGKNDEAIAAFKQALKLNLETAESYWFLGMAYAQIGGNNEEAIKYVKEAIRRSYNYKRNTSDTVRLINLYKEVGDYYGIIDCYKVLIDSQPNNAQLYAYLAVTYKTVGDTQNAIFYALKAAEIDPKFASESEAFINSLK